MGLDTWNYRLDLLVPLYRGNLWHAVREVFYYLYWFVRNGGEIDQVPEETVIEPPNQEEKGTEVISKPSDQEARGNSQLLNQSVTRRNSEPSSQAPRARGDIQLSKPKVESRRGSTSSSQNVSKDRAQLSNQETEAKEDRQLSSQEEVGRCSTQLSSKETEITRIPELSNEEPGGKGINELTHPIEEVIKGSTSLSNQEEIMQGPFHLSSERKLDGKDGNQSPSEITAPTEAKNQPSSQEAENLMRNSEPQNQRIGKTEDLIVNSGPQNQRTGETEDLMGNSEPQNQRAGETDDLIVNSGPQNQRTGETDDLMGNSEQQNPRAEESPGRCQYCNQMADAKKSQSPGPINDEAASPTVLLRHFTRLTINTKISVKQSPGKDPVND